MRWPDCSPPKVPATLLERHQDVAVADVGLDDARRSARGQRAVQARGCSSRSPRVRRRASSRVEEVQGEQHHQVIAVAHVAPRVDRDQAVGVAVEGETQVGVERAAPRRPGSRRGSSRSRSLMLRPSGWSCIIVRRAPVAANSSWATWLAAPLAQSSTRCSGGRSAGHQGAQVRRRSRASAAVVDRRARRSGRGPAHVARRSAPRSTASSVAWSSLRPAERPAPSGRCRSRGCARPRRPRRRRRAGCAMTATPGVVK